MKPEPTSTSSGFGEAERMFVTLCAVAFVGTATGCYALWSNTRHPLPDAAERALPVPSHPPVAPEDNAYLAYEHAIARKENYMDWRAVGAALQTPGEKTYMHAIAAANPAVVEGLRKGSARPHVARPARRMWPSRLYSRPWVTGVSLESPGYAVNVAAVTARSAWLRGLHAQALDAAVESLYAARRLRMAPGADLAMWHGANRAVAPLVEGLIHEPDFPKAAPADALRRAVVRLREAGRWNRDVRDVLLAEREHGVAAMALVAGGDDPIAADHLRRIVDPVLVAVERGDRAAIDQARASWARRRWGCWIDALNERLSPRSLSHPGGEYAARIEAGLQATQFGFPEPGGPPLAIEGHLAAWRQANEAEASFLRTLEQALPPAAGG